MVTRSEAPDLAVDELKRRARRRLIGAIVLALAAAVLLPLLLESEPKPLGDEVSIQIPPIDNGKFVNPLSPGKVGPARGGSEAVVKKAVPAESSAAPTAPSPSVTPPAAGQKTSEAAEPSATRAATSAAEEKSTETKSIAPAAAPSTAAPAAAPTAPTPSVVEPKKETPSEPKANPKQSDAATGGAFVVQVAAFTDRYGAQAQARKLKNAGFPAYVEAVASGKGELQRVRVGPYASRDAADAARVKLKAAGYDAIVARAR
jgi:DedD protein